MPRITPLPLPLLLALCLGGCTPWNNAVLNVVNGLGSEQPDDLVDKTSGTYKGSAVLAAAISPACPTTTFGKISVGDQRLYFAYLPDTIFIAPIQSDGTMHAISGPSILDGTAMNGRLMFTIRTPVCEAHYDMRYVI